MRCVGAENPPCARCLRTNRRCVVSPSRRGRTQANSLRKRCHPVSSSTGAVPDVQTATPSHGSVSIMSPLLAPPEPPKPPSGRSSTQRPDAHDSPPSISRTDNISFPSLPSVYSLSPLDALGSLSAQETLSGSRHQHQRQLRDHRIDNSRSGDIPENVLVEYIEL